MAKALNASNRSQIASNLRRITDPVYNAQMVGRRESGYSGGSAGGPVQTVTTNANNSNNYSGGNSYSSGAKKGTSAKSVTGDNNAAYLAMLQSQLDARNAAAQGAYDRNMSYINSAYDSAAGNLRDNYDSTVSRLNAAKKKALNDVNVDAEDSMKEAYLNYMLTRRGLDQRLSAMGYNGGAAESTMASLNNNYGNSRLGIDKTRNRNISDLNELYADNLAAALESYNNAMSNLDMQKMQLEMQAENALAESSSSDMSDLSSLFSMDQSYLNALQGALQSMGSYQFDPSEATNDYIAGNVQQAAAADLGNNYQKYLQQAQLEAQNGSNPQQIRNNLFSAVRNGDLSISTLANILSQLGAA